MGKKKKRKRLADTLSFPEELTDGGAILYAYGNQKLYLHNYKGIIEDTSERIRIHTRTGLLTICGMELVISYYTKDEMKIEGQIYRIEFGGE
jgi:sporulation protein YqfC